MRLAGVHREGELAALMESWPRRARARNSPSGPTLRPNPTRPNEFKPKKKDADAAAGRTLPKSSSRVRLRQLLVQSLQPAARLERVPGPRRFRRRRLELDDSLAKDDADGDVEIKLAEDHGSIRMPDGQSAAEFTLSLIETLSPPRSGGCSRRCTCGSGCCSWTPAIRRSLLFRHAALAELSSDGAAERTTRRLPGRRARRRRNPLLFRSGEGDLVGIEMQAADDEDPCEIYFSDFRPVDGRRLPHHWTIRHGDESLPTCDSRSSSWPARRFRPQ